MFLESQIYAEMCCGSPTHPDLGQPTVTDVTTYWCDVTSSGPHVGVWGVMKGGGMHGVAIVKLSYAWVASFRHFGVLAAILAAVVTLVAAAGGVRVRGRRGEAGIT